MDISVIIPVKNRAHLLPFTLDNILSQSKKAYEIIVVNDHSTDNIGDVIKKYNKQVIFLNSNSPGPGAARNTGLKIATGNVIQFFDSDDLMTSNKLQVQAHLLNVHKADFVHGPFVKAKQENTVWMQVDHIMQYYPLPQKKLADIVLEGWCAIFQSALFRKEFLLEVGSWREDIYTHEDFEFWFRIGKASAKFIHENESCVIYRQHNHQLTDKASEKKSRWLDGIKANRIIAQNINYNPSFQSLLLFKGRNSLDKRNFKNQFAVDPGYKQSLYEDWLIPFYKLNNKYRRLMSGSNWQRMHGVLKSTKQFETYISMLH